MNEEKPPLIIHRISTEATGWQDLCNKWAETKKEFQVEELKAHDFAFCQQLCEQYDYIYLYESKHNESIARFLPKT